MANNNVVVLLLTGAPEGWDDDIDGGPIAPLSGYPFYKKIEACGEAHLRLVAQRLQKDKEEEEEEEEDDDVDDKAEEYSKKRKTKDMLELKRQEDHYALLGLGHLRWKATEKDIKKAYRQMILSHHPDKQAQGSEEINDEVFKAISKAYEVLSNPERRRTYDSQESFDDSIPTEEQCKEKDFFVMFGATFERNARFSVSSFVPNLGDLNTPMKEVQRFYDFWFNFKSWRDFSFKNEYDLNEAEFREEKRWMERQNKKKMAKLKKEEHIRVLRLVQLAYKYDPRIIQQQKEEEDEKNKKKRDRAEFFRKQREEQERQQELARQKKEEEERVKKLQEEEAKKAKSAENKAKRKKRQKLRALCKQYREQNNISEDEQQLSDEQIEYLCSNLNLNDLSDLIAKFTPELFNSYLSETQNKNAASSPAPSSPLHATSSEKAWSESELNLLTKALSKFPVGTRNRWDVVREFLGGNRTNKEVIAKANELKLEKPTAAPSSSNPNFNSFINKKKKPDPNISDITVNFNINNNNSNNNLNKSNDNNNNDNNKSAPSTPTTPSTPPPQSAEETNATTIDPSKWPADKQSLLEKAMRNYPSSMGDERWNKIAADVPGMTRKDCILRYKYLVAFFKQQKK